MASRDPPNKRKQPILRIEDKEVLGPFPIIVVKHVPYFVCDANLQKITVNLINWLMGNNVNIDAKEIQKAIDFLFERDHKVFLLLLSGDIKVGEFICVEKPIASHPLPEYLGSNCAQCFKAMKAPLPCPNCTKVLFCSYDCRAEALSTYHPYECKIFDFLIASGMSIICFLAYKAIVQKPLKYFLDNRAKFEGHDESSGVNIKLDEDGQPMEKYLSSDYRNYFNLVTHHSERQAGDIFHR